MTFSEIHKRLQKLGSAEAALNSARFFKTGQGQYGEGDLFLGVCVPDLRVLAREFKTLPTPEIEMLLRSEIHESRSLALLILVGAVAKCDDAKRKEVFDFYIANTKYVNNWDLVDSSAPPLAGAYLFNTSRRPLYKLARSTDLWERRIAIVATQHFIRHDDFADTLKISRMLLGDTEDLIHKATGWMLREVGKRDQPVLEDFLERHAGGLPSTMLRYAVERFANDKKKN